MRNDMVIRRVLLALIAALVLAACGAKGDLYLPEGEKAGGSEQQHSGKG